MTWGSTTPDPDATVGAVVDPLIDACGEPPGWLCEQVYDWTDGNETAAKLANWFIDTPLSILLILLIAWVAARLLRRYLRKVVERIVMTDTSSTTARLRQLGIDPGERLGAPKQDPRKAGRADSIASVVGSTVSVLVWVIALLLIVGELGIDLGPLIAGAGIAGVALGFGAQSLVKDCISGLFMLIEDHYGLGDIVDVGEAVGTVEEITLRATVLRDLDGTVWHVPNGEIMRVGNMSQQWSVAVVDMDVAYDADLELVREVMLGAAGGVCASEEWADKILEEPQVLGVEALGANAVTMRWVVKTTAGTQWALRRELREAIKAQFDSEGIEIPFPQRTVYLRGDDA
jgi:small-conductance mechanosensitive channel